MQQADTQGQPRPAAAQSSGASVAAQQQLSEEDRKLTKMSKVMVGAGAAIAISALLPWTSGLRDNFSPIEVWQGWSILLCGIGLAAYGYQGLTDKFPVLEYETPYVRHHGWAIAALSFSGLVIIAIGGEISELSESRAFEVGIGILPATVGLGFATWALVALRRDGKRREEEAMHQGISAGSASSGGSAAAQPGGQVQAQTHAQSATAPAGWYADPTSRHERRYFNGVTWTEHVVDGEAQSRDPLR